MISKIKQLSSGHLAILLSIPLFLFLSLYHFFNLRHTLLGTSDQAPLSIQVEQKTFAHNQLTLIWQLSTSTPRFTTKTGIYWGSVSTPSALPISVPPRDLPYSHFTPDYQAGQFYLPDSFTTSIDLSQQTNTIYYRAYARLGDAHYWTPQYSLSLTP